MQRKACFMAIPNQNEVKELLEVIIYVFIYKVIILTMQRNEACFMAIPNQSVVKEL